MQDFMYREKLDRGGQRCYDGGTVFTGKEIYGGDNMQIAKKFHRGSSVAAGIILILGTLISAISMVLPIIMSNVMDMSISINIGWRNYANWVMTVAMAVMMFRGKKDMAAGILFLVTAVYGVITSVVRNLVLIGGILINGNSNYMIMQIVLYLAAALIDVAWRVLIALECFMPGKISCSFARFLLILTPILTALTTAAAQVVIFWPISGSSAVWATILPTVVAIILSMVGPLVSCISASIPVWEAQPVYAPQPMYDPQTGYRYY